MFDLASFFFSFFSFFLLSFLLCRTMLGEGGWEGEGGGGVCVGRGQVLGSCLRSDGYIPDPDPDKCLDFWPCGKDIRSFFSSSFFVDDGEPLCMPKWNKYLKKKKKKKCLLRPFLRSFLSEAKTISTNFPAGKWLTVSSLVVFRVWGNPRYLSNKPTALQVLT